MQGLSGSELVRLFRCVFALSILSPALYPKPSSQNAKPGKVSGPCNTRPASLLGVYHLHIRTSSIVEGHLHSCLGCWIQVARFSRLESREV